MWIFGVFVGCILAVLMTLVIDPASLGFVMVACLFFGGMSVFGKRVQS